MNQSRKKPIKDFNEYGINGPRPPVPGEESQMSKMTTEGASHSTSSSNSNRSPDHVQIDLDDAFLARIEKWQESFSGLRTDQDGVDLLYKFVEQESGKNSLDYTRLMFYFAVDGLKFQQDEKTIRVLTKQICKMIHGKIQISPDLQKTISDVSKRRIAPNPYVFDDLQKEVEEKISTTFYRAFLQSDMFIQFAQGHNKEFEKPPITNANHTSCTSNVASTSSSSSSTTTTSMISTATDGAAGFSGMTVELSPYITTPTLQTLHEDTELKLRHPSTLTKTTTDRPMPKLTNELLLATARRRLEIRPEGALFAYNNTSLNVSYNPVSRQDSERQSCSSASLTDSEINSKDGKPYIHRKPLPPEDFRKCMNPHLPKVVLKPSSHGMKEALGGPSKSRLEQASRTLDTSLLCEKLNKLKREQESQEQPQPDLFSRSLNDKLQQSLFTAVEEDDQSILDHHCSMVWSPTMSPGTSSPGRIQGNLHKSMHDFATHQYMRSSRSIPEHASTALLNSTTTKKLSHKWPSASINHDSGIDSLYSASLPYKSKEMKSTAQLSDERKSSKGTRKQMSIPHQTNYMPTQLGHHTNSLPRNSGRMHVPNEEVTTAVYVFGDEELPYLKKIPATRITLKLYKQYLPKRGNFRYFFQTKDSQLGPVHEEVTNDDDLLPMFDERIMGTIKPGN